MLLPVLSPNASLADHGREAAGEGTWTVSPDLTEIVTEYWHHNPWVCSNPSNSGPPSFTELDCVWPGSYSRVAPYTAQQPQGQASRGEIVVTRCERGFNQPPDCGHNALSSEWTFAGSRHAIHLDDRPIPGSTGYVCSAAATTGALYQASFGPLYYADGHPVNPTDPLCGTFTPTTPSVSIAGVTVTEGTTARLPVTVSGSGSGSVNYATANGTATAGSDYRAQTASLPNLVAGRSYTVNVPTIDDSDVEGPETFTVTLSGALGVGIGTATATVTIIDDDSTTPTTTTTTLPPTGCAASTTRLSSLTVTAGGSNQLSGFSSTTYSYSLTVDESSVRVDATASSSVARVEIGNGAPSTGSASRTLYLSEGSTSNPDVTVTAAGESCTYTLEVSRPAGPVTDCPAWSGLQLVGGVCVEACPASLDMIPEFDADGQVNGCIVLGDCPYDQYNFDPTTYRPVRNFGPLWQDGPSITPPVAPGVPDTFTRTVARCSGIWRESRWRLDDHCADGRSESNVDARGDCVQFSLSIEAVAPSNDSYWIFTTSGCHNRSLPVADTWVATDAVCSSADGTWTHSRTCSSHPSFCAATAPTTVDTGQWTVALDVDNFIQREGSYNPPFVDTPIIASITDWGDVSHLRVTLTATSPGYSQRREYLGGGVERFYWRSHWTSYYALTDSTTVIVPRRSGPPPSDDVIQVNVADVAALGYDALPGVCCTWTPRITNDHRFVNLLRSELLANDACEIGIDCSAPQQWPMELVGQHANGCEVAFPHFVHTRHGRAYRNQWTDQGAVGCDRLNDTSDPDDPANVRYWPKLWATGTDTFQYATYGGTATVTFEFTDQPPIDDITVYDPGTQHAVATYDTPTVGWATTCANYIWPVCRQWEGTPHADYSLATTDFTASYHTGVVPIGDPDGDIGDLTFRDGQNTHLTGRLALNLERGVRIWSTDSDTGTSYGTSYCFINCYSGHALSANQIQQALRTPVNTATATPTTVNMAACGASTYRRAMSGVYTWGPSGRPPSVTAPATVQGWNAPTDTDPDCIPAVPDDCLEATLLHGALCYSVWPHHANPAPLVVDYRACDERFDAFDADQTRAQAAGRTADDYCVDGTITVLLGSLPTVTVGPASATEGTPLQFPVTLNTAAAVDVTVTFSTQPDTAGTDPAEAGDYLAQTNASVTIPAGQTSATATVFTIQDSIYENDETLRVVLTGADLAHLGTSMEAVGTIANDDSLPAVSLVADVIGNEDDGVSTGSTITFTIELVGGTERWPIRVAYSTSDDTATGVAACQTYPGNPSEDYASTSGVAIFNSGDTSKTFDVNLCADDQAEGNEAFTVTLNSPANATLGASAATGEIADNDSPPIYR